MNLEEVSDEEIKAEHLRRIHEQDRIRREESYRLYMEREKQSEEKLAREVRAVFPGATAKQIDDLYVPYMEYIERN
jgi:hypothetical protein